MSVRVGPEVPLSSFIVKVLHFADLFKAIFLGIIEGLTEFIPVSSTAHLLITSYLINFQSIKNSTFEIVIQLGAILAICVIYRQKLFFTLFNFSQKKEQKFTLNIFLAFLPAALVGLLLHRFIKEFLFSNFVIALALIFGGILMILVDKKERKSTISEIDEISPKISIYIGLFQCLAMIPGFSRSGATIIGGLLLGLKRKVATEFSFFLAIPTIAAASFYDLIKNYSEIDFSGIQLIIIGLISSFLAAMLVIKWFVNFVSRNNFFVFGIYRIALGALILLLIF